MKEQFLSTAMIGTRMMRIGRMTRIIAAGAAWGVMKDSYISVLASKTMRVVFLISIFTFFNFESYSQPVTSFTKKEEELYKNIKDTNYVEGLCVGLFCGGGISKLWRKADTLFRNMPLHKVLKCFDDSSKSIKYYVFLKLLDLNDTIAFRILRNQIKDSAKLLWMDGDELETLNFNGLLAGEYKMFITQKYNWGVVSKNNQYYFGKNIYKFPKRNENVWQAKIAELNNLLFSESIKIKY